jgi:phage/plasmid-like protein (TIGR03299 family)
MAYRKESEADVPWHGLGSDIDHDASPTEMLQASGLDWRVDKRPLFAPAAGDEGIVSLEDYVRWGGKCLAMEDFFALVRDSDNKVLGPCGKDYVPTQNEQAMYFFKKFTDAGSMRLETAGSLQGGKQVWALAKINEGFELAGGDTVGGYLLLSSPHVWGKALVIKFTPVRVVCHNTLMMAMADSDTNKGFRAPHIRPFDDAVAEAARESLGIAEGLLAQFEAQATLLSATETTPATAVRFIAEVMQPEAIEAIFGSSFRRMAPGAQCELLVASDSPTLQPSELRRSAWDAMGCLERAPGASMLSAKGTMWGALNAVTYYVDHVAGRSRDNALTSSWFGLGSAMKRSALSLAVGMAEAVGK